MEPQGPDVIPLSNGQVIAGWVQGIAGMRVGGRRELIIPPALAYGSTAQAAIPANSTLIFIVDLLAITPPAGATGVTGATIANGATGSSGATGSTGADRIHGSHRLTPLDLLAELVAQPPAGCDYAEARWVDRSTERLRVSGGAVERVDTDDDDGVGIRVAVAGRGFGFAATRDVTKRGLERALARAVELAAALPAGAARPWLDPLPPARGHWRSPCEIDPFARSLDDRLELLLDADAAMRGDPRIVHTEAQSLAIRTTIAFASSEGAAITQERIECGGGIAAHAAADGELQTRSYPNAHGGSVALAGYEHLLSLDLRRPRAPSRRGGRGTAERAAVPSRPDDARARRRAARAPGPRVDRPRARARPHPARRDLLRRHELGLAGRHRHAALRLRRCSTSAPTRRCPAAWGAFGWDDEGVAAQRIMLIDDGILRATLSDRMSAATIGVDVRAARRARTASPASRSCA